MQRMPGCQSAISIRHPHHKGIVVLVASHLRVDVLDIIPWRDVIETNCVIVRRDAQKREKTRTQPVSPTRTIALPSPVVVNVAPAGRFT